MLQKFEVLTPLFEGQANERLQFKLNIDGHDYRGIFHNEEVHWFQPQPHNKIDENELDFIESNVCEFLKKMDIYFTERS
ncbi:hypothetical protein [Sporosarcina sp. D27]|uniref:hypothetical protein n=1 Tax=Sporosarcina sp. D27 TaxID=1382305 RepID=UPI00046F5368|nr:hypothetical protein [Sporosarcina sp. D27]